LKSRVKTVFYIPPHTSSKNYHPRRTRTTSSAKEMEDTDPTGEKAERGDSPIPTEQHQELGRPLTRTKSKPAEALARIASHLTTRSIRDPGPPPDGGIVAWTQICCAFLAVVNSWGFVNSFGAFQPYYETILPQPSSSISWIGSIQAFLVFSLGIFSGRALDRGWFRPTIALGIAIQILGIFAMSGATTYWQFLLTQGFCTGVGGGIFFVPISKFCCPSFTQQPIADFAVSSGLVLDIFLFT
jgi:hypothetical protein